MADKKRILNIVPVVSDKWNASFKETLSAYASPEFALDFKNVAYGGEDSIEGLYSIAVTVPYIVDEIIEAEKQGYAAVTSLCFGNPGVSEARELVDIPVVGAGEAPLYTAMMCGDRIGIVTIGGTHRTRHHGAMLHLIRRMVKSWDVDGRVVYYGSINAPVEDCGEDQVILKSLERESLKAVEEGAEVIILGCTGMTGFAVELQKRLRVPVIDPSVAALKFAEMLVAMNLTHSRLTIPTPEQCRVKCVMKWPPTLGGYPR